MKIGRYEYDINEKDIFMDNGACIQLTTQSKENSSWGGTPNPVLSQALAKKVRKMELISRKGYWDTVKYFSIKEVKQNNESAKNSQTAEKDSRQG